MKLIKQCKLMSEVGKKKKKLEREIFFIWTCNMTKYPLSVQAEVHTKLMAH